MRTQEIAEMGEAAAFPAGLWQRKARILIVDDEVSATRLLKKNLEETGDYSVRTENDAAACVEAALDFMPDVILLDIIMPGIDGGELALLLRGDPRLKSAAIVFLTAVATKADIENGGGAIGGMPFLAKPVGMPEILGCLREHLRGPRSTGADVKRNPVGRSRQAS